MFAQFTGRGRRACIHSRRRDGGPTLPGLFMTWFSRALHGDPVARTSCGPAPSVAHGGWPGLRLMSPGRHPRSSKPRRRAAARREHYVG